MYSSHLYRSSFLSKVVFDPPLLWKYIAYKEEIVIEIEKEMEIGHPTDVKHVTHIGLDGSTTTNPIKSWNNNVNAPEILSFRPTISLKQFEQAMAAQTQNHQCWWMLEIMSKF